MSKVLYILTSLAVYCVCVLDVRKTLDAYICIRQRNHYERLVDVALWNTSLSDVDRGLWYG
jgi:hypothetical protein